MWHTWHGQASERWTMSLAVKNLAFLCLNVMYFCKIFGKIAHFPPLCAKSLLHLWQALSAWALVKCNQTWAFRSLRHCYLEQVSVRESKASCPHPSHPRQAHRDLPFGLGKAEMHYRCRCRYRRLNVSKTNSRTKCWRWSSLQPLGPSNSAF